MWCCNIGDTNTEIEEKNVLSIWRCDRGRLSSPSLAKLWSQNAGFNPFNSHEWLRQNFSQQYQYFAKQTSNEYKENIKQGIVCWSKRKFFQTNIIRIVWQTVRRITYEILGVIGLNFNDIKLLTIRSRLLSKILSPLDDTSSPLKITSTLSVETSVSSE